MFYGSIDGGIVRRAGDLVEVLDLQYTDLGHALSEGVTRDMLDDAPTRTAHPLDEVVLLAPVPRPPSLWAAGLSYRDHQAEARSIGVPSDDYPMLFLEASSSVTAHEAPIRLPQRAPDEVDYEGEIALVIAVGGRDISVDNAWDHIFGITAANDVSARDVQWGRYLGGQQDPGKAKSFDTFTPMGPWIVTPDEFPDRNDIGLRTIVDGVVRQEARSVDLVHPVPAIVAFLSEIVTLVPGDVILTGTPGGVGHPSGRFLHAGSTVEVEVECVGTLRNPVVGP